MKAPAVSLSLRGSGKVGSSDDLSRFRAGVSRTTRTPEAGRRSPRRSSTGETALAVTERATVTGNSVLDAHWDTLRQRSSAEISGQLSIRRPGARRGRGGHGGGKRDPLHDRRGHLAGRRGSDHRLQLKVRSPCAEEPGRRRCGRSLVPPPAASQLDDRLERLRGRRPPRRDQPIARSHRSGGSANERVLGRRTLHRERYGQRAGRRLRHRVFARETGIRARNSRADAGFARGKLPKNWAEPPIPHRPRGAWRSRRRTR